MKKAYQYIALAVLALGFAACTQEEDFTPQGNQKGAPLAIASAGVANLTTRAAITTTDGTDYLTGGSMGVFVKSENTDTRYKGDNLKWDYDGNWEPASTTVLYEADGAEQTIGAYYPYTSELTDGTYAIVLPEAFESDYEDYDYLYADYVAVSANPMNIGMNHLLSKVTVSLTIKENTIEIDDAVKSVSLHDVPRTAVWTVPTATLSAYGSADQVTELYANDTDNDETVDNYVGYALPNAATTLSIRVTMTSGRIFTAKAAISGGMTDGVHYKIGLNVGKDKMEVSTVTVAPWGTPENNVSGSEPTEIFIHSTVSGTTAVIDIVSGATEGVQNAIAELLETNTSVTTLTVKGTPNEVQQEALTAALANFNGTLIMDMTDAAESIKNLSCKTQLGGHTVSTSGTTTTYTIYTEAGLNVWREAVENNYQTNLTLGADIILSTDGIEVMDGKPSDSNWISVSSFKGTLDGGGHSIVNLRIYSEEDACFISVIEDATIKNLTFVNPVIYGEYFYVGTLASKITSLSSEIGGSSIIGCHVQGGSVTGEQNFVGGLIGSMISGDNYVYGCTNSAKVTGYGSRVGGIVATSSSSDNIFVACANTGEVIGNSPVGGIIGNPTYEKLFACYTTEGNLCGRKVNSQATNCYYVAAEESDEEDGTTAVADETALNTSGVVDAMNAAISTYNNSATVKATYKWKVGTTLPELETTEQ